MPPTIISHRPQTLKQAKKAYRKSGATVRLSASELAVIERRAVLQERADRIREREARRKVNLKKKEERNQKEREARQKMGIAEPVKEGIHVGPSQLSLGKFMDVGQKRKRGGDDIENTKVDQEEITGNDLKGYQTSSIPRTPWRNPLKVISPNSSTLKTLPLAGSRSEPAKAKDSKNFQKAQPPLPSSPNVSSKNAPAPQQQQPQVVRRDVALPLQQDGEDSKIHPAPMGPPPPRKPMSSQRAGMISKQKPILTTPQYKPPDPIEDCWDDFFASSTQIARELSPPPIKPPSKKSIPTVPLFPRPAPPPQPPNRVSLIPKDDTSSLLDDLSTQDLDYSGELTQAIPHIVKSNVSNESNDLLALISTQDLDFSGDIVQVPLPPPPPLISAVSSDFDEDLTEEDLEDVAQEFERESTTKSESKSLTPQKAKGEAQQEDDKGPLKYQPSHSALYHDSKPPNPKLNRNNTPNFSHTSSSTSKANNPLPTSTNHNPAHKYHTPSNHASNPAINSPFSKDEYDETQLTAEIEIYDFSAENISDL